MSKTTSALPTRRPTERSTSAAAPVRTDADLAPLYAPATELEWLQGVQPSTRKGRESILKVLEATKSVLISHGYVGLTLRLVAERAEIAHSNVQYYFATKEYLIENFMLYISSGYRADIRKLLDSAPNDPMERFIRYIRFYIDDISTAPVTIIFAELRAMSQRSDFILDTLDGMYVRYRAQLESLLAEINPDLDDPTRVLRAALIISLIDGLMIFIGGKNARHAALATLGAEAEREILRIATAPA
jgi:AcrR family transcriptional regulator